MAAGRRLCGIGPRWLSGVGAHVLQDQREWRTLSVAVAVEEAEAKGGFGENCEEV